MNKYTESRFATTPSANIRRSSFMRPSTLKTTFNAGYLVPIFLDEVLPGDTFSLDYSMIVRQSTSIHPTMDNAYIDTYFFYVPFRLLFDNYEKFEGANDDPWTQETVYEIPQLFVDPVQQGSLLDYLALPIGYSSYYDNSSYKSFGTVSRLPVNAYQKIWSDWFRDENLESADYPDTTDSEVGSSNILINGAGVHDTNSLYKVAKFHDYFTSALPQPQKHGDVLMPLGQSAPVFAGSTVLPTGSVSAPVEWKYLDTDGKAQLIGGAYGLGTAANGTMHANTDAPTGTDVGAIVPANLFADLSLATAATVNQLRLAIQTQRLFERDAHGTRMNELLRSHFGISAPDARLQRSEYLGGKRTPINLEQVVQTSRTDSGQTPLGNLAAFGKVVDRNGGITKSFVERGLILGLACVRTDHTYCQGIDKLWSRKKRLDFFYPVLANIGEQPILNREIYAQGGSSAGIAADEEVFGYQEAWADYRYARNKCTSAMSTVATSSLASWNYADKYTSKPTLGSTWIKETTANVDRTLAVQSSVADQYIADFYFNLKCVRPMPLYSIPGLMDHF